MKRFWHRFLELIGLRRRKVMTPEQLVEVYRYFDREATGIFAKVQCERNPLLKAFDKAKGGGT